MHFCGKCLFRFRISGFDMAPPFGAAVVTELSTTITSTLATIRTIMHVLSQNPSHVRVLATILSYSLDRSQVAS